MKTVIVDAVGEPCPVPVVKATKALRELGEPGTLEVRVDNEIAGAEPDPHGGGEPPAGPGGEEGRAPVCGDHGSGGAGGRCPGGGTCSDLCSGRPGATWWWPWIQRLWDGAATNWGSC